MEAEVYWLYNETFGVYHPVPLAGKRAFAFLEDKNQCKGGHWVLHMPVQYDEWFEREGKFKEDLEFYFGK
jgi:hypothetical protein